MKYLYLYLCIVALLPFIENRRHLIDNFREFKMAQYIKVATYMTKRFISPKTNTLIIMENCKLVCKEHHTYHTAILHNILNNLNDTLAIQLLFAQPEYRPWDYNLFIVDSWSAFESLRIIIPATKHERDFYFFILLTWYSDFILIRNLIQIFQLCLRFNVNNVVVMANSGLDNSIGFYSYDMFNSNHCGTEITAQEINRYEDGQLKYDFLFPTLLNNFFGCPLAVTGKIIEPLLTFEGDLKNETHLMDMQRLGGIEGEILKLVAEALNFKIHMRFTDEVSTINLNLNSTGCFKDLEQNSAQIAIGGLSSNIANNSKFTRSFAYHSTPYKFVVRSNVFFGPIKQLVNPLNKETWIFLLILFASLIILIQVIFHLKFSKIYGYLFEVGNKEPTFKLVATFLGYPLTILPKRSLNRVLLVSWMFLVLAIRNGYQGKMFDSLRLAKRMPVPKTITELIAMDYTLLNSAHTSFYPSNKTLISSNSSALLQQIQSSEEPLTAAAILESLAHYNYQHRNTSTLTPVDETIYSYQCVMYFSKYSILRNSFERKLEEFTNSGITSHIAKKHFRSNYQTMDSRSQDIGRITSRNLRGLYYIYGIMCQFAIFIFILELLTKKSNNLKRIMDWLN